MYSSIKTELVKMIPNILNLYLKGKKKITKFTFCIKDLKRKKILRKNIKIKFKYKIFI